MTFPKKKPHQRIKGYVLSVFDLIEHERAIGIPLTEIHKNLCLEAGYESAYSTFANARVAAKKMRVGGDPPSNHPLKSLLDKPASAKPTEQNRSFVWTGNKNGLTLEDFYKKKAE